jgi:hypothetical protein
VLQRHPVEKLKGDERLALPVVNFVNSTNVWILQRKGSLGSALKAPEGLRVFGYVVGQQLQGNEAAELDILGIADHTHASTAKFLDSPVVRDGLADHSADAQLSGRFILLMRHPLVNECGAGMVTSNWNT